MTDQQAPPTDEPQAGLVPVQVGASVRPGPDGTPWVALQLATGVVQFGLMVDVNTAVQLRPLLDQVLGQAIDTAKRQGMGLLLPHEVQRRPPAPPTMPDGRTPISPFG